MATSTEALLERIVVDSSIMAGKPVVRGTRVPVELVLRHLAEDPDVQHVLAAFPRLTADDVRACIAYAAASMRLESVYLDRAG